MCCATVTSSPVLRIKQRSGSTWAGSRRSTRWFRKPDVTIFIDTPVAVCSARIAARGGGADLFHETVFLTTVRGRYEDVLATSEMLGTLLRIDGDRPVDDVEAAIAQALAPALRASGLPA